MVYRGWTIGCAVQCTVYSVFYSVCWDTTVVLAQWFVVAYTLYIVRCTSSYGRVWCMVHGAWCSVPATVRGAVVYSMVATAWSVCMVVWYCVRYLHYYSAVFCVLRNGGSV